VLAKVKAGGLTHNSGARTFIGKTVEVFDGFPAGSLMFCEPEDNAGLYLQAALAKRERKARASRAAAPVARPEPVAPSVPPAGDVDAAKDKALLDAFSQAITAAMGN
jgi:hypothetical protein